MTHRARAPSECGAEIAVRAARPASPTADRARATTTQRAGDAVGGQYSEETEARISRSSRARVSVWGSRRAVAILREVVGGAKLAESGKADTVSV